MYAPEPTMTIPGLIDELQRLLDGSLLLIVFQPILDSEDGQVLGYEALLRGPVKSPLRSPLALFAVAKECKRQFELELQARQLAIKRFSELGLKGYLFLNASPSALLDGLDNTENGLAFLKEYGLTPADIIIEITEHETLGDFEIFKKAVIHYRELGFKVAMDDLGDGSSTLRLWSELHPEFVKLDKHFIKGIDQDKAKRQFVASLHQLSERLGCRIIAEGVETDGEFKLLRRLNIPYLQGYYLGRPEEVPQVNLGLDRFESYWHQNQFSTQVKSLVQSNPSISPSTTAEKANELFLLDTGLKAIVVTEKGVVQGMIRRQDMMNLFAARYGRELNGRKPARLVMNTSPVVVESHIPIEKLSRIITESEHTETDIFVVTQDGVYLGVGQLLDLLREVTNLQVRNARYANPLTLLPGNVPIDETAQQWLDQKAEFVACYVDIDNFKAYNDQYGYKQGDDIIRLVARLLKSFYEEDLDLIGHIGGDDFLILIRNEDWKSLTNQLLKAFEKEVLHFYKHDDIERGGIQALDRQGNSRFFPFMSLSIGAVPVTKGRFKQSSEIAGIASEVKKKAKTVPGNVLVVCQRNTP